MGILNDLFEIENSHNKWSDDKDNTYMRKYAYTVNEDSIVICRSGSSIHWAMEDEGADFKEAIQGLMKDVFEERLRS